ncbi:hypothetical protein LCGC14_1893750 [marine sediment metagenome]|uniref:Uncharacterized protein n=1 Tax=marine sediment metagenome TaxID=412755 RepID=A0A0F9IWQ9_9ZZZZ
MKIPSPFTTVTCPICGTQVRRRWNTQALAEHIKNQHPTADTRPLVEMLSNRLGRPTPHNIAEIGTDEMLEVIERMAQDEANKEGLANLRRQGN